MSGAFPFKAARPKGSSPSMSFEMPKPPPAQEPEIPFTEEAASPEAREEIEAVAEQFEQEEDVAKKRRPGRPKKTEPTPTRKPRDHTPKFTFAEVAAVFGEDVPFVKVIAKIAPVIEILKPEDRKRVVDILVRLYG